MIRIIEGRGTGKTLRLMLIAKEQNAKFVCSDPHGMKAKALAYGITGIDFISYGDFREEKRRGNKDKVVIDELEHFLYSNLFPEHLIGYTLSNE